MTYYYTPAVDGDKVTHTYWNTVMGGFDNAIHDRAVEIGDVASGLATGPDGTTPNDLAGGYNLLANKLGRLLDLPAPYNNAGTYPTFEDVISAIVARLAVAIGSAGDLNNNVVGPNQIVDGSVGAAELATNSVTTPKIGDGQVTGPKLAADVMATIMSQDTILLGVYDDPSGPWLFNTPTSAPLPSPYTEANRPDQLLFLDTGSKYSVDSNGQLVASSATTDSADPIPYTKSRQRSPGRFLYVRFKPNGSKFSAGWGKSTDFSIQTGVLFSGNVIFVREAVTPLTTTWAYNSSTFYELMIIQANTGSTIFIKGGAWSDWTLLTHANFNDNSDNNTASPVRPMISHNGAVTIDTIYCGELGGPWAKGYGPAEYAAVRPTLPIPTQTLPNGDGNITTDVDMTDHSTFIVKFRIKDPNNFWQVVLTEDSDLMELQQWVGGVMQTPVTSGNPLIGDGATMRLNIRYRGASIVARCIGTNAVTISKSDAAIDTTATGWEIPASTAVPSRTRAFRSDGPHSWPMASGHPPIRITYLGDSITLGQAGDDPQIGKTGNGYRFRVVELLEQVLPYGAMNRPTYLASGGWKTADIYNAIDAWLAAATDTPDYAVLYTGTNDSPLPSQSTFETQYGAILDKLKAKWPNVRVVIVKPWIPARDTDFTGSIWPWIDNTLKTRPWARALVNVKDFLSIQSGGVYINLEGPLVHPNRQGYDLLGAFVGQAIRTWQGS